MIQKILSLILLSMMAVIVTNCTYKPKYACPPGKGIECRPIGEIYDAIREDRVDDMIEECNDPKSNRKNQQNMNSAKKTKDKSKSGCKFGNCGCGCSGKTKTVKKVRSHHQNHPKNVNKSRIWLAPYTNDEGVIVGEHYIEIGS